MADHDMIVEPDAADIGAKSYIWKFCAVRTSPSRAMPRVPWRCTAARAGAWALTIATEAGVPESILWMQFGHAQDRAARRYVRLTNPDRLYDTWRAFRL